MSVRYLFVCDGCGKTSSAGVPGQYVHPDPPLGWLWNFGPGLEPPHTCSEECWQKVARAEDGRLRLSCSHEDRTWVVAPRAHAVAVPKPEPPKPKKKPGRKVKPGSLTDVTRRVERLESAVLHSDPPTPLSSDGTR